ncbi:MAG: replication-relaxation family protein [Holophagales bacterium]|nr:replication-relaxation family protein [Holophagales bacterium]
MSLREHAVLELITRLRLVPLVLVHDALFKDVSRQVVGRFVNRMVDRGWLQTWSEPTERGGNPTWIYATAAGRTAGLGLVLGAAEGTPFQQLVATMLPSARTRPLELAPRIAPAFLRHQRETATLLVRLAAAHGAFWYSAWDRPLPQGGAPAQLPQPDGVLVLPGASGPELVFLEHDRGMESPAHFARAKAARYAELAVRPELCQRLLGFPTFRLAVTVENARLHRHPLERLGLLSRLLREAGAAREAVLSLAGWANAWPGGAVWCRAEDPFLPASRPAVELQEPALCHTLPCPPSGRGEPCACSAQRDPSRLLEVDGRRPCG